MKSIFLALLLSASAFATMSATVSSFLPSTVESTRIVPYNTVVTAQITVGNSSGSSVNIISVRPFYTQTGETKYLAKSINFGQVCLSGVGGTSGYCNNFVPANTNTLGGSLVLNVPMVFLAPSTLPPYVTQNVPQVGQFGPAGTAGSSLTFGFGGSSVLSTSGTYTVDAVLQGNDGSYFTCGGGATLTAQAIVLPDSF